MKSRQTFRKRQRERALREKAQRKHERRQQRQNEKKESPTVVPEPSTVSLTRTEVESTAGDSPEG